MLLLNADTCCHHVELGGAIGHARVAGVVVHSTNVRLRLLRRAITFVCCSISCKHASCFFVVPVSSCHRMTVNRLTLLRLFPYCTAAARLCAPHPLPLVLRRRCFNPLISLLPPVFGTVCFHWPCGKTCSCRGQRQRTAKSARHRQRTARHRLSPRSFSSTTNQRLTAVTFLSLCAGLGGCFGSRAASEAARCASSQSNAARCLQPGPAEHL